MPSHETVSPLVRSLAAALAAFVIAAGAMAQPTGEPPANPTPSHVQLDPFQPPPLIDVDFPGGSVSKYCDAVRAKASPNVVNVILTEGAGDISLPPISLKQVTVEVAMKALISIGQLGKSPTLVMDRLADRFGASAFVLRAPESERSGGATPRWTTAHSLRSIAEPPPGMPNKGDVAIPVDTVMAALTAAVRADDQGPDPLPELMLHRESLMLVSRGTSAQQKLIDKVLDELGDDMANRRSQLAQRLEILDRARLDRVTSEAEVKQAQVSVAKAENDYQEALHNLDLIQKRVDSGLSPQTDLSRAQGEVTATNMRLEGAKTQYEAAKSRAAVLAERQEAMTPPAASPSTEPIVVVYNIDDFAPFKDDILTVASDLLNQSGGKAQWTNNSLVVTANPERQQAIQAFLLTLRRVKANDPQLAPAADMAKPGLDDDAPK